MTDDATEWFGAVVTAFDNGPSGCGFDSHKEHFLCDENVNSYIILQVQEDFDRFNEICILSIKYLLLRNPFWQRKCRIYFTFLRVSR